MINVYCYARDAAQIKDVSAYIEEKKDIFVAIYTPRDTIYANQTGKFPHASSLGYNYKMTIHNIDDNPTWANEPMKDTYKWR